MNIAKIFTSSIEDITPVIFPTPSIKIEDKNFKHISTAAELIQEGKIMNNCLIRDEKIKYYIHQILNGSWTVYHIEYKGTSATAAVDKNCKLLEIEQPGLELDKKMNHACRYGKRTISKLTRTTRPKDNRQEVMQLKKDNKWLRYNFVGTKENKPYHEKKSVIAEVRDSIKLIVSDDTQERNNRHKVINLHHLNDIGSRGHMAIGTESFGSEDDCFHIFYFSENRIYTWDVNGDPINTFEVIGTCFK